MELRTGTTRMDFTGEHQN